VSTLPSPAADGLVIAWRTLKRVPRIPELAIFAILQSIMFVVLFAYVFGGAIPLPGGGSYREYLMPGIFVQTLAFAGITTAIAFADDMTKGIIDRFRSLPMARSAVLSGRTFADVLYTLGILVVLMLSGLVVGWRVHSSLGHFLLAVALMVFFTYSMAWVGVYLGLVAPTVETVQQLGFPKSCRVACVSALIGFHSAIGCRTAGSVAVGTNAFERKVNGKMIRNPSCCTVSTVGATSPR